ncbi:MAG: hypothetical protein DRP29_03420 [Thermodesulfobacteriota bacterium]|nr:MAG: hypothetical protein DRP29_03420 [Thermodesulfobacteriota bacterium]RLG13031.1 MAG: hypothetical protein DRN73_00585 [Candidatus Pacearchaeota archaeon]
MKVIFDSDIPEEFKEQILEAINNENIGEVCKECGSDTLYVAYLEEENILDVKCYNCGYSYLELELEEEEE